MSIISHARLRSLVFLKPRPRFIVNALTVALLAYATQAGTCRGFLRAILANEIPLAALWVFDFKSPKADFSITADNERAWQLDLISEANKSLSRPEGDAPR